MKREKRKNNNWLASGTAAVVVATVFIVLQGCSSMAGLDVADNTENIEAASQNIEREEVPIDTADITYGGEDSGFDVGGDDGLSGEDANFDDNSLIDDGSIASPTVGNLKVAEIVGDVQEIIIAIDDGQFSVDAIVLQADRDFIIRFDVLDEPDLALIEEDWEYAVKYFVNFPGYGGGIDLVYDTATPALPPIIGNFVFGDVYLENVVVAVIVPDINNFDEPSVIATATDFLIEGLSGSGFACH